MQKRNETSRKITTTTTTNVTITFLLTICAALAISLILVIQQEFPSLSRLSVNSLKLHAISAENLI